MLIPGLLQNYSYAASAIHAAAPSLPLDVVGQRADERRQRIDRLGRPGSRTIGVIVDEGALHRAVGGYTALTGQLEHLLALAALQPSLTVRVLPQGIEALPAEESLELIDGTRETLCRRLKTAR
ncbi:Scr1 family TA system antitoxin-like transcriptional regulator [Streptomyces sp. NPDC058467]|uniref:Scr1 family TA system antitoxin-like transcriptional regulator n=1 Tax=Streptomyces sp. NPDC058467 TaxID=3346513 RepID=UPI003667A299